jgi:hypothetical protein
MYTRGKRESGYRSARTVMGSLRLSRSACLQPSAWLSITIRQNLRLNGRPSRQTIFLCGSDALAFMILVESKLNKNPVRSGRRLDATKIKQSKQAPLLFAMYSTTRTPCKVFPNPQKLWRCKHSNEYS